MGNPQGESAIWNGGVDNPVRFDATTDPTGPSFNAYRDSQIRGTQTAVIAAQKTANQALAAAGVPIFFANLANLVPSSTRQSVVLDGYSSVGDGGGGLFVWNASSTAAPDGGTISYGAGNSNPAVRGRWLRSVQSFDHYRVTDFGAKGDGSADDTNSIQAAINAAGAAGPGSVVTFPVTSASTYKITSPLVIPAAGAITLRAAGQPRAQSITISASWSVPAGNAASITVSGAMATLTGLSGVSTAWIGSTVTVSNSVTPNNTSSTVIAVDTVAQTVSFDGYSNQESSVGVYQAVPDSSTTVHWTIKPPMVKCYTAEVTFEGLTFLGNGVAGAGVDSTATMVNGTATVLSTANRAKYCQFRSLVYGWKQADLSGGSWTGAASIVYPFNCDLNVIEQCIFTNCEHAGFFVPNPLGQSKNNRLVDCSFTSCSFGILSRTGTFGIIRGNFSSSGYGTLYPGADVWLGNATGPIVILDGSSELSRRNFIFGSGSGSTPFPISVIGFRSDTSDTQLAGDKFGIIMYPPGGLLLQGCNFGVGLGDTDWTIGLYGASAAANQIMATIINCVLPCGSESTICSMIGPGPTQWRKWWIGWCNTINGPASTDSGIFPASPGSTSSGALQTSAPPQFSFPLLSGSSGTPLAYSQSTVTLVSGSTTTLSSAQLGTPQLVIAPISLSADVTLAIGGFLAAFDLNADGVTLNGHNFTVTNGAGSKNVSTLMGTKTLLRVVCSTTSTVSVG